jgi:hypothetical protein
MSADDRDSGAAQLLGNGGKIEPYTIIIMDPSILLSNTCVEFLPALVRSYNAGLSLALLLLSSCSSCGHINQNTALLSNFTMLSAYCTISCTFAPQPCLATLPGPAAFPGSFARQPCSAALPGSFAEILQV